MRTDKLRVELPASERRAQELRKAVTAYSIVHFRGRIAETLRGSMAAEAVRIVATSVVDSELETHAGKLRQPVILRDDVLGTFALDRSLNWFNGKCAWNGKEVKLTLAMEDDDTSHAKELVSTAHALMRSGRLWSERITKYIAGNLLPLYNTSWRQHDAPVLTASAFLPQLRLRAIIVSGGGRFEFEFGVDGELFGGHAAAIRGSLTKGVQDFELQG